MYLKLSICFFVIIGTALCKNEDYKGYKVYKVKFTRQEQQDNFHLIQSDSVDYWRTPSLEHDIVGLAMVPPSSLNWFEEELAELDIERNVHIEDVQTYLAEKEENLKMSDRTNRAFTFDDYYSYNEILTYLRQLEGQYSTSGNISLQLIESGYTDQNRSLVYMKITNRAPSTEKPVVVIEGGIIPRDWITIPSAINVVMRLINEDQRLLNDYEWVIIPVVNPDGYEYTRSNLRLWMKSRSTRSNLGIICPGVNINRNFDVKWQLSGTSTSPCSHLFGGINPFSEPETQMLRSIFDENYEKIQMYISIQNSGGAISYPWFYERAATGLFRTHHLLGLEMVRAIGDEYSLGPASTILDRASGTSMDYARINGVRYSYNIDVVHRGQDGVNIPVADIRSISDSVWRAITAAVDNLD